MLQLETIFNFQMSKAITVAREFSPVKRRFEKLAKSANEMAKMAKIETSVETGLASFFNLRSATRKLYKPLRWYNYNNLYV